MFRRRAGRHNRRPARTDVTPAAAATSPPSGRHEVDVPTDPYLRAAAQYAAWYQDGAAPAPPPLMSRPRPVTAQTWSAPPTARPAAPPPQAPPGEQAAAHPLPALAQARRRTGPPTAPLPGTEPSGRHRLPDEHHLNRRPHVEPSHDPEGPRA